MNVGPSNPVLCPICKKSVIARGMGGHMRLAHPTHERKTIQQLSEPELPFTPPITVKSPKKATQTAIQYRPMTAKEQKESDLTQRRLIFAGLIALGFYYYHKAVKQSKDLQEPENLYRLSKLGKRLKPFK